MSKDKWQCPLCGKKFKAEEFVHKHILNKHGEKVKEVQKEVGLIEFGLGKALSPVSFIAKDVSQPI